MKSNSSPDIPGQNQAAAIQAANRQCWTNITIRSRVERLSLAKVIRATEAKKARAR